MTDFGYWLRRLFGIKVDFACRFSGHGRIVSLRCCGFCGYRSTRCYHCIGSPNDHSKAHFRCRHCTNPHVKCRRCGVTYLDSSPPGPQWTFTLLGGWRHTENCTKGAA